MVTCPKCDSKNVRYSGYSIIMKTLCKLYTCRNCRHKFSKKLVR